MAERPEEPTIGNSSDVPYGYQIIAFVAGGNSRKPVLLGDSFTGAAGLNFGPIANVSKFTSE